MNLSNYCWWFQNAIPERICDEIVKYGKSISDQIQVITKDLKTLEKAVYQKSDISNLTNTSNSIKSDGPTISP